MRIDRTHKSWFLATASIFGVSLILYALYRVPASKGPMGGTALGLAFGALGFAFMIFAALLGARKRVPIYRLGRAQTWMRGHLWLGLVSFPLILFHSGFRYGHGLTWLLMTLLILVVASGIIGAALQHYMPRVITREVPLETIFDEIGHVREQLLEEAEEIVKQIGTGEKKSAGSDASEPVQAAVAVADAAAPLRNFYEQEMKPFLARPGARASALADAAQARTAFAQLKTLLPASLHLAIEDLESICEEERQLTLQSKLHRWLHGWLLVHIPLSLALILLAAVHAVMALRF